MSAGNSAGSRVTAWNQPNEVEQSFFRRITIFAERETIIAFIFSFPNLPGQFMPSNKLERTASEAKFIAGTATAGSRSLKPALPIIDFDYIELYVGNAKQAAFFYERALGFEIIGYRGLETGERHITSYALRQNNVKLLVTSSQSSDHEVARHVAAHGDGVRSIGLAVSDARLCYLEAVARGAQSVAEPHVVKSRSGRGSITTAAVKTYGDTTHTFIQREDCTDIAPLYELRNSWSGGVGFDKIDHVVGNVESGKMLEWVAFYERVFGFHVFQGFNASDINTQYSSLASRVMANANQTVKMPINEPAKGERTSQIQEYLDFYRAPGVQHIAMTTNCIISTVTEMRRRGVEFLSVPEGYYKNIGERIGYIEEDVEVLSKLGILIDRESTGYLLQIFTKPLEDRPTLFLEVIQRKDGASGFGKGNFKALFESLEREQDLRGNL